MSTRSGKRIHGSVHENVEGVITEMTNAKKTRGKPKKENNIEIATEKKRKHYVRYPSEEQLAANDEKVLSIARKSQRNTLKELNIAPESETTNDRNTRLTRRTRRTEACPENVEPSQAKTKGKKEKNKLKKTMAPADEDATEPILTTIKKKSNKKKNKRKSGSIIIEDVLSTNDNIQNTSNISMDSFHSAASSPRKDTEKMVVDDQDLHEISSNSTTNCKDHGSIVEIHQDVSLRATRSKLDNMKNRCLEDTELNTTNIKEINYKKKKSNEKPFGITITSNDDEQDINAASIELVSEENDTNNIKEIKEQIGILNTSGLSNSRKNFNKKGKSKITSLDNKFENMSTSEVETVNHDKSSDKSQTFDTTYENSAKKNTTFDKTNISEINLNTKFEKDIPIESEHSKDISNNVTEVQDIHKKKRRSTYNKLSNDVSIKLNLTFDKEVPSDLINVSDHLQDVANDKSTKDSNKKKRKSSARKSLSENIGNASIINLDATYEKDNSNMADKTIQENGARKSIRLSKLSIDQGVSTNLNSTYDKISVPSRNNSVCDKSDKINTTYEMDKNFKDTTFDKSVNNETSRGSSLISTDTTSNVTSEISKDISHVSLTSDESMGENIVNTTPVLIESSMDESHNNIKYNEHDETAKDDTDINNTKCQEQMSKDAADVVLEATITEINIEKSLLKSEGTEPKTSNTPLKREGYTETMVSTPPRREGTFTENKNPATPKGTLAETKPNTPIREGTYTELKTATPLKREGTYTEMNPVTTQPKNGVKDTKVGCNTPLKVNGSIENNQITPLKREGTFTKEESEMADSPKIDINRTPSRRKSMPSPGCTPFPVSKSSSKKNSDEKCKLNITRSIEKPFMRLSSADSLPRATRVMFCSPIDTPAVAGQMKGKVIKSNLKGSDKSFVFDESVSEYVRPARKRSYTQSEADSIGSKRKRLTEGQQHSVDRLSRPRTSSASGILQDISAASKPSTSANKSKTELTPSKSKAGGKVLRTKLPNFAALHQKRFAKMESLDECQERKAKRARQLLTPTGSVNIIERVSPKEAEPVLPQTETKKTDTPKKSIAPQGYTRFGFKLNLEVNPFSIPAKTDAKPKSKDSSIKPTIRRGTLPSLAGATSARKVAAKQVILREKSSTDKRDNKRNENRTVIKGVRTNRRFELQMKLRNV
ncbi:homeobox-like protein HDP1 [Bicyclus anynana]|uniref:Homeobox-like protein HDP1 n=1 Tax=Bicyclus anynana TaxID=110368 RepID=A0ABM3LYB9_BICAN|nr:homeobox-like protein HDP1 [Bicyclus anynana]